MTEYVWSELRAQAITAFGGEFPSATLEAALIEVFGRSPARVVAELPRVAEAFKAGRIRSGWAVWKARVDQVSELPNPTVTDTSERDRKLRMAAQWVRSAGCQFDRESEIVDELFGHTGMLRVWVRPVWAVNAEGRRTGEWTVDGDQGLVEELVGLWRLERPRGQLCEAEMERRAAEHVLLRKRLAAEELARQRQAAEVGEEVGV